MTIFMRKLYADQFVKSHQNQFRDTFLRRYALYKFYKWLIMTVSDRFTYRPKSEKASVSRSHV